MPSVTLAHRATLRIGGAEAEPFLQRLLTADLAALPEAVAHPCALLSPQGKVLHEFLIARDGDEKGEGFLIDVSRAFLPDLARRLMLYRLHAAVTFEPRPSATVRAVWDEDAPFRDARFGGATGSTGVSTVGRSYAPGEDTATIEDWSRVRIAAGVAELGTDYAADDLFPHDLGLPATGGVAVTKGCYVGQEVVSRMHHRGTGRRRVVVVRGSALPPPGTALEADGKRLGTMGGWVDGATGSTGLAVMRTDRVVDAIAAGLAVSGDGMTVVPEAPPGEAEKGTTGEAAE